jgi:hypothetical protein
LIGLGRYDDACNLFHERLSNPTLYRLNASRQGAEMLELLFPNGLDQLPCVRGPSDQAFIYAVLALSYDNGGQPGRAVPVYRHQIELREGENSQANLATGLENLSNALQWVGALHEAETTVRRALMITHKLTDDFSEGVSRRFLGLTLRHAVLLNLRK